MALVFAGAHELRHVLRVVEDGAAHVRRAGRDGARGTGALRDGGPAAPARRPADADARHRAARAAQRVRDRAQSGERGRLRDGGDSAPRLARRARGVLAHELAHIKNRDMLLQTFTATMAGAISNLAHFGLFFGGRDDDDSNPLGGLAMVILAPIAAMLIQFAISRQREFKADAVGAQISGRPRSLANALRKLDAAAHRIPMHVAPAVAPLAQVNPLRRIAVADRAVCSRRIRRRRSGWRASRRSPPNEIRAASAIARRRGGEAVEHRLLHHAPVAQVLDDDALEQRRA